MILEPQRPNNAILCIRWPWNLYWMGQISWARNWPGGQMGAKIAAPEKFVVNFMGDAAFGMTGLDFETAVRSDIPKLTVVLNNSTKGN
ncbi:MAG: hypothetical protein CM1200mP3_02260 [Chloroflexota bacterium]|nr:MAG: hypothetical protein CM1200mP3_02260 [Chloroflexota bacterium]